ncbi:MAG: tetratricopeptide repeat protein [Verrucomicrobiae bacterium]|nr:tetratricopeptide repeat protein [Verrucomicrobiae bacterium]
MKKILLPMLLASVSVAWSVHGEDELLLAVNTNFRPARPAGAAPAEEKPARPERRLPTPRAEPEPQAAPTPVVPEPTAAATPAPPPAPPPPALEPVVDPARAEAETIAREELVRREEALLAGQQLLREARVAYADANYRLAAERYEAALKAIPVAPVTESDRAAARDGLARTYYRLAEAALDAGDVAKAREHAGKVQAIAPDSRMAAALSARIERAVKRKESEAKRPEPVPDPAKAPEFLAKREEIKKLFRQGKLLMNSGQFDEAERAFQQILLIDPYNSDAYVLLDDLNVQRRQFARIGTDRSRNYRLWEVEQRWLPSISAEVKRAAQAEPEAADRDSRAKAEMNRKLSSIVIEQISFRDAVITDVVNFLSEESRRKDPTGVNIVLQLGEMGVGAPTAPAPTPVPGAPEEGLPVAPAPTIDTAGIPRITVTLFNIPLGEALRLITQAAGLKFRVEPYAVVILPKAAPEEDLITRSYPVEAGVIRTLIQQPEQQQQERGIGAEFVGLEARGARAELADVRKLFEDAGVPFPPGSSIIFNERASRIIIRNTPANIEIFEDVLAGLNVVPTQVEIEAKFIEIAQADLDELGFDWKVGHRIFGSFDAFGGGDVPFGDVPDLAQGQGNISRGLRDSTIIRGNAIDALLGLGGAGTRADIGTLRGVLTNPQFELVVRALAQKKGTDLLSAPRITTISGNAALIRVVQEFIYPTEFEAPQVAENVVSPFTPSGFKTREVGVLLNVTPQVGADNYTINLTLIPEVSEFLGFIDYSPGDTVFQRAGGTGDVVRVQNRIQQPLFASRNLTTSVVIWDGHTVVLGGLMREDINKIEDKIPFLGDLPFIGRLFRSKVDSRSKRNLLIFVTANLINPAGNRLYRQEAVGLK